MDLQSSPLSSENATLERSQYGSAIRVLRDIQTEQSISCLESGIEYIQPRYWKLKLDVNEDEVDGIQGILRSINWRMWSESGRQVLLVINDDELEGSRCLRRFNVENLFAIVNIERIKIENRRISFHERAMKTLENIELSLKKSHENVYQSELGRTSSDGIEYRVCQGIKLQGIEYGCDERSAPGILQYLLDEGFTAVVWPGGKGKGLTDGVRIGSRGFHELDQRRQGLDKYSKGVFFARPWDPSHDELFGKLRNEVRNRVKVDLGAVWDFEHTEQIDEFIFRSIDSSRVVVVDCTGDNFNVGLELGYALALKKPIVLIRKKTGNRAKDKLPFDIQNLNCFFYDENQFEQLVEKVVARIEFALNGASGR